MSNKWAIEIKESFLSGSDIVLRSHVVAIPPTNGDRVDIIDSDGRYHYNTTVKYFNRRMTKDEYLALYMPDIKGAQRLLVKKSIDYTPRFNNSTVSIVIEIISGVVNLKSK